MQICALKFGMIQVGSREIQTVQVLIEEDSMISDFAEIFCAGT